MNKSIFIGNLTRDPLMKSGNDGRDMCNFTIAVDRRTRNGEKIADFINVTVWGQLAVNCGKYLTKGKKVCTIGEIRAGGYQDKDGQWRSCLNQSADQVEFISPKTDGQAGEGFTQADDEQLPF